MKYLSFFIILALALSACSDTGTDPVHSGHPLRSFFAPASGNKSYEWIHQDTRGGFRDSLSAYTYIGQVEDTTIDGFTPVSVYRTSVDTGKIITFEDEYYLSDEIVIRYGKSSATDSARIILLKDTLRVGKTWRAADAYFSSYGIPVRIDAEVSEYYAMIHIGNKDYSDVYRVTYYPLQSVDTLDKAFMNGARHIYYYARNIGKVLEMVYAPDSSLVWKNELVRER